MSDQKSPKIADEATITSMEAEKRARSPSEDGEERDDEHKEEQQERSLSSRDSERPLPQVDEEAAISYDDPPPLPDEPEPVEDDGWEARQDTHSGAWYFFNKHTGLSQWENPRTPDDPYGHKAAAATTSQNVGPGTKVDTGAPGTDSKPAASLGEPYLGYNPRIHGDFDPNADYAKFHRAEVQETEPDPDAAEAAIGTYDQEAQFGRFTGKFTAAGGSKTAEYHNDENKSKRQLNAFFDVDSAANAHEGKSLKAERSGQKLSKKEVKQFNERRRARKEQKRRDFLMS